MSANVSTPSNPPGSQRPSDQDELLLPRLVIGQRPQLPLDPAPLQQLLEAWARHEAWFQLGSADLDAYTWPVAGTYEIAQEGRAAYMAYRDYLAETVLQSHGHAALLDDLRNVVHAIEARTPGVIDTILEPDGGGDDHFRTQWNNLFSHDPVWPGLSHEALSAYVRKYEVERPLRILVWLRELYDGGRHDPTLRRFRDRAGRLKKGVMADYATAGFRDAPALRAVLAQGYSSKLRNLIGHNEYRVADGAVTSIDGGFAQTDAEVFARYRALGAIHNALIWLASIRRHDPRALAACGVIGLGWVPLGEDGMPRLLILQLAAFREFDPAASWVSDVRVTVRGAVVATTVGPSRERKGTLEPSLRDVLARAAELGQLSCEVVGVVPCLHSQPDDHTTYTTGPHRYCEFDSVDCGLVLMRIERAELSDS